MFPENQGFNHVEELDEWVKPTIDGYLVLWKKPNYPNEWQLSYVDKEDYLHPIRVGPLESIEDQLLQLERDRKLSELLSK